MLTNKRRGGARPTHVEVVEQLHIEIHTINTNMMFLKHNRKICDLTHNLQNYDPVGLWKAEKHLLVQPEAEELSEVGG